MHIYIYTYFYTNEGRQRITITCLAFRLGNKSTWSCPKGMGISISQLLHILPVSTSHPFVILATVWLPLLYSWITLSPHHLINYFLNRLQRNMQYICLSMHAAGVFTVEGSHWRKVGGYPAGLPHTQPEGSGPESEKQGDLGRRTRTMLFYSLPFMVTQTVCYEY